MGNIINSDKNRYRVVLVKTIDRVLPIYYKVVDLSNYKEEDIPAYRILDDMVNNGKHIENIRVSENKPYIIDEDGYRSFQEVVLIDEFDKEIPSIYDWAMLRQEMTLIKRYDIENNEKGLKEHKIDSSEKLAWKCKEGHTIYCGFSTFYGCGCKCPICEAKDRGEIMSLRYWGRITKNQDIVKAYEDAIDYNTSDSRHISWNSKKEVWFKVGDKYKRCTLSDVTNKRVIILEGKGEESGTQTEESGA